MASFLSSHTAKADHHLANRRSRGSSISNTVPNQYSREPLSAKQSWGQAAYPAVQTPAQPTIFNPSTQPVAPVQTFTPAPQLSAYQHGIHNPAVEDLATFSPPVPHYEHGKKTSQLIFCITPKGAYSCLQGGEGVNRSKVNHQCASDSKRSNELMGLRLSRWQESNLSSYFFDLFWSKILKPVCL